MTDLRPGIDVFAYSNVALPHLTHVLNYNLKIIEQLVEQLVRDIQSGRSLFVFGSGHSALLPLELYHRAGGPSFLIPIVADHLLPSAGPSLVRLMERIEGSAIPLLNRVQPQKGEMIWIVSQSGINAAGIELAIEAKARHLHTVAFTSLAHSNTVASRHKSKKKLYEVCDLTVDLGGVVGDAAIKVSPLVSAGPLSTLGGIFLAHSILSAAIIELERKGVRCAYTSVNTPEGELRNEELEELAKVRDPLLR